MILHNKKSTFNHLPLLVFLFFWHELGLFSQLQWNVEGIPWQKIMTFKMFKEVRCFGINPTNPQCLTKDYIALGKMWMRQCIVEKSVLVCRFNIETCQIFQSENLTLKPKNWMNSLLTLWENSMLGWNLFKSSKNKLSFFYHESK